MNIVAFITARLDEDEAGALAATPGPWHRGQAPHRTNVVLPGVAIDRIGTAGRRMDLPVFTGQTASRPRSWWEADAAHIARHDPAHVLAEVKAKRAIVARHQPEEVEFIDGDGQSRMSIDCTTCDTCGCVDTWPCDTLKLLAAPDAEHPDYNPAWRVE